MKRGQASSPGRLDIEPVTPARWPDLERLFGAKGACAGCWCMYWRLHHKGYVSGKGVGNKRRLKRLVAERVPDLIGYVGGEPAGWCCIAPARGVRASGDLAHPETAG